MLGQETEKSRKNQGYVVFGQEFWRIDKRSLVIKFRC